MAVGLALKGVASLFPSNTIVNKLANAPTSIKARDVTKAIADVKGSVTGKRGFLGESTPGLTLFGKAGVKTTPAPTPEKGGLNTLQPSTLAMNSALASQRSVTQSLTAGSLGVSAPTSPNYASDFGAVDTKNPDGIKYSNPDGFKASGSVEINPWLIGAIAVGIYLINKR